MLKITPNQCANSWCIYVLMDETGRVIFIWYRKLANALSIFEALTNPNLDGDRLVTFSIIGIYPTKPEAYNAWSAWLKINGLPELNLSVRFSHYGAVRCNETGQVFRNQAEAARVLGLNQSRLSQHLRRTPGFKSVNKLTFSMVLNSRIKTQPAPNSANTPPLNPELHPIQFPPGLPAYPIWTSQTQNPPIVP